MNTLEFDWIFITIRYFLLYRRFVYRRTIPTAHLTFYDILLPLYPVYGAQDMFTT